MVPIASAVATDEPGDRREQRAGHHRDQAERALHAAQPRRGQIDQRLRHPAAPHERRGHDEQRQRHQRGRVELVDHVLRQRR